MTHQDELLDLVNKDDQIIGTIWRSEYDRLEAEGLGYIRAVDMFIQNDNGELWIPKRTAHKKIAPNGLDYSAGGHVSSGETYDEAVVKEISEELNIEIQSQHLELLGKLGPDTDGLRYFRNIYRYRSNEAPNYNLEDFVSAEWLSVDALVSILESGTPAKASILPTIKAFQEQLNSY
jgi:isopentenyl-diphosphate delta-isomerase